MLGQKEIGAKLKDLRERQFGRSVRHFQQKSGVSRGSVPGVEKGLNYPRIDVLEKWLKACKVTFAEFFGEAPPPGGYKPKHKDHHDQLEFVLTHMPHKDSATLRTLSLEYEDLKEKISADFQANSRGSPSQ
ncbi:MAG: helix-turn-helix transcriptional regulator [Terrimicrobiaceae bacterium]|nr:helix-turn-helix transcriptional regulator [Terrimicrobiaceae bacterium]